MTQPVHATCVKCNEIFSVKYIEVYHSKGIKETFFNCTHCQRKYVCFVTDHEVRKMQKDKAKLIGIHNANKRLQMQDKINQRMARLKMELIGSG